MSILIAEDNMAQRHYLREILEKEFPSHVPGLRGMRETVQLALVERPRSVPRIQCQSSRREAARAICATSARAHISGRSSAEI